MKSQSNSVRGKLTNDNWKTDNKKLHVLVQMDINSLLNGTSQSVTAESIMNMLVVFTFHNQYLISTATTSPCVV
jgi:hypothetical protein